jgi:hypothetical protein
MTFRHGGTQIRRFSKGGNRWPQLLNLAQPTVAELFLKPVASKCNFAVIGDEVNGRYYDS